MHLFRVWAPKPQRVDLVIDGVATPMVQAGEGWWEREVEAAGPGTRYAFSLDGGPPRPDPRSAFQPEGVDGPSEVVDHSAFRWSDHQWTGRPLQGSVLYELHVGTFSAEGTFDGAIAHLPHLVDLGVDGVELLPVAEFSGTRGWGYDGVDLFAPHSAYGGPEGLKRLVDACHAHGIGVVMDVVYNHLGPAGNYLPQYGPYFSDRHQTNWGDAFNYDGPLSGEVRRLVVDNALMWLRDYHIDGLRLDAVHAIVDDSAVHLLEQMAEEVWALSAHLGRNLFLVVESDLNNPRFVLSRDAGGLGMDASWSDEWHHALHATLTGERSGYYEDFGPLELLAKALKQAWVYDGIWSPHRKRVHGRSPEGLPGDRFVVSTQNHDQVGNRALGERSGALMSEGRLKVAAALMLTSPFVPLLFQGEEWAAGTPFQYFTDHRDPELGRAVSEGRRSEFSYFGWEPDEVPDPQDQATFQESKLDWSEIEGVQESMLDGDLGRPGGAHAGMLRWYRDLIALRRRLPGLTDPRRDGIEVSFDEEAGWLVYRRGAVAVALNVGKVEVSLPHGEDAQLVLASGHDVEVAGPLLILPPDSVAVVCAGARRRAP
ncbi:MAG TPA: malto-oligosyltrehalose trehalohydrolase [Actinomycetota bacterium]|nr:malto-oligosyltrehalose trehalohydrolase [Actinomycetota bacterium]